MANLAIKGHATRGKEVIQLLEMLGGKNIHRIDAIRDCYVYFVLNDKNKTISTLKLNQVLPKQFIIYSLEEFLEKYPYKVGDKVTIEKDSEKYYIISKIIWNGTFINYDAFCPGQSSCLYNYLAESLQPYKEETMEEDKKVKGYCTEEPEDSGKTKKIAWFTFWDNDFADEVELYLKDRELVQKDGKWFVVKKKKEYPKTYEGCCEVLGILDNRGFGFINLSECENILMSHFIQLKRCRDAYWKIAGEQMGLDKPWKPDYSEEYYEQGCPIKYVIYYTGTHITKERKCTPSYVLAFPTEEMRDTFFENFKDLIEQCKELL